MNQTSPVNYFLNGSLWTIDFLNASKEMSSSPEGRTLADATFGQNDIYSSSVTRSIFIWGRPLHGYCSPNYKLTEQNEKFSNFINKYYEFFFKEKSTKDLDVIVLDEPLFQIYILEIVTHDIYFIIGSIIAVWFILFVHSHSLWIASLGLIHIILSYFSAGFFYRIVFQIKGFPAMIIITLYIILGIGCDDCMLFVDKFKQSFQQKSKSFPSLDERMAWVWSRSCSAMTITSFTTFTAFVCTAISPIPTISVIGLYAAFTVLCNFLLVISWFPAVVLLHHIYQWDVKSYREILFCNTAGIFSDGEENSTIEMKDISNNTHSSSNASVHINAEEVKEETKIYENFRLIESFYYYSFSNLLYRFKYFILVFFVILIVLTSIGASFIQEPKKLENIFPLHTPLGKAFDALQNRFPGDKDSYSIQVHLVFGLKSPFIDRSIVDKNDIINLGKLIYDESFDLSTVDSQSWMLNLCDSAISNGLAASSECFIKEFKEYIQSLNLKFPLSSHFYSNLSSFILDSPNGISFRDKLDTPSLQKVIPSLRFASISFVSTLLGSNVIEKRQSEYEKWNVWLLAQQELTNDPITSTVYHTSEEWVNFQSAILMRNSAWLGVSLSLIISFIALTVSTKDFLVSFIAVMCICAIVSLVVCIMVLMNWKMDLMESIAVTLLVGVSIDFCAHFSHAYIEASDKKTRFEKSRHALSHIGISVIAGGLSTLLATFFLLFCWLDLFFKMGAFLFITIGGSLLYSHFPFTALLMTFGPETDAWNIIKWKEVLISKFKGSFTE